MARDGRSCMASDRPGVTMHSHHQSQGSEHHVGAFPQLLSEFRDDHAAEQVRCAHVDRSNCISGGIRRGLVGRRTPRTSKTRCSVGGICDRAVDLGVDAPECEWQDVRLDDQLDIVSMLMWPVERGQPELPAWARRCGRIHRSRTSVTGSISICCAWQFHPTRLQQLRNRIKCNGSRPSTHSHIHKQRNAAIENGDCGC